MVAKNRAEVVILTSQKIDLKTENVTIDKEGHYVIIKECLSRICKNYKHAYTKK